MNETERDLWVAYGMWCDALARGGTHFSDFKAWREWRPDQDPAHWVVRNGLLPLVVEGNHEQP